MGHFREDVVCREALRQGIVAKLALPRSPNFTPVEAGIQMLNVFHRLSALTQPELGLRGVVLRVLHDPLQQERWGWGVPASAS